MTEPTIKPPHGNIRSLIYAVIFGDLQMVAKEHGYSLAVHGSMQRDFDLVAIPWTDEACDAQDLINSFVWALKAQSQTEPTIKPHGRIAWFIILEAGMGVDVSVMPRK